MGLIDLHEVPRLMQVLVELERGHREKLRMFAPYDKRESVAKGSLHKGLPVLPWRGAAVDNRV